MKYYFVTSYLYYQLWGENRDQEVSTFTQTKTSPSSPQDSTRCSVIIICRCRTVLVLVMLNDMKARLTSRVVPPYTSYTGHTVAAAAAW